MKRLFDIVASGIGLVLLGPLFLVLAIWIKMDSKGPVFYRQVRVGKNNKNFRILKFRSMHVGADKGSLVTIGGRDSRITRSGYYIRKYKFDEIPQLIKFRNENELMEKAEAPEDYYINVIMQEKIKLYLEYVENASFWYDIKLIFMTFKVIITER